MYGDSVADQWPDYLADLKKRRTNWLSTPWPDLGYILDLEKGSKRFAVLALPWEPAGETPFCIAQSAARQGANPLCLFPSWSPYWDGTLRARRRTGDDFPQHIDYDSLTTKDDDTGLVIIDQFSRLHWGGDITSHKARESVIEDVSQRLLALTLRSATSVLVIVRRQGKGPDMSMADLRSDGALIYDSDVLALADPDTATGTATVLIAKDRSGPAPVTRTISWAPAPRTVYRKS